MLETETHEQSGHVGNSEQGEKGRVDALGCSKNDSQSNTDQAAHHLQRLTQEQRLCQYF